MHREAVDVEEVAQPAVAIAELDHRVELEEQRSLEHEAVGMA